MKDLQEDNLFGPMRERLGRYEEAPSGELWEKIASRKREGVWGYLLEPVGVVVVGMLLLLGGTEERKVEVVKTADVKSEVQEKQNEIIEINEVKKINEVKETKPSKEQTIKSQQVTLQSESVQPLQLETRNSKPEADSTEVVSPIIMKKDSSTVDEVVPPYKKPKSKFQIYLSVTPSLSFQKMSPTPNDDVVLEGFAPRSPMSLKRFGFGIDAGFQRDINRFLGFYGGLSFYRQDQEISYTYFNKDGDVTRVGDSWTFDIVRPEQTSSFEYNMTNLGVRSGLLVTVKGRKLKHKFGAGLLYSQGFAKSSGPYNNSRSSYLAYQLSYRNELLINDHLSWFIEPVFTYSFLSKEKLDEPFKLKPYRAGISTGLLYRF